MIDIFPTGPLIDYRLPFDTEIFHALNGLPWFAQSIARLASNRLFGLTCVALAFTAILWHHGRRAFAPLLAAGLALGGADLIGARLLKPFFHRQRPCFSLSPGSFHQWIQVSHSASMPSLHAANSFALAFVLSRVAPGAGLFGYSIALLVSLSRISLGIHWPSDVLAGAAFGTLVGILSLAATRRAYTPPQRSQGGGQAPASASMQL